MKCWRLCWSEASVSSYTMKGGNWREYALGFLDMVTCRWFSSFFICIYTLLPFFYDLLAYIPYHPLFFSSVACTDARKSCISPPNPLKLYNGEIFADVFLLRRRVSVRQDLMYSPQLCTSVVARFLDWWRHDTSTVATSNRFPHRLSSRPIQTQWTKPPNS